jgi:hypothetical protein
MKAGDLAAVLGCRELCGGDPGAEIRAGYTSDLLSDVMANAAEDSVLVTIQAHKNTVAVASISGMRAIVICNDRPVPDDMLAAAAGERIAVLVTGANQFTVSHRIALALEPERR